MSELCEKGIHNFRAVHEGLIGGKILAQCEGCNRVEALWITAFHKAVAAFKTAVEETKGPEPKKRGWNWGNK